MNETCQSCGKHIYLIQSGRETYHWVDDPDQPRSWHCGFDPDFPVKGHAPAPVKPPRNSEVIG